MSQRIITLTDLKQVLTELTTNMSIGRPLGLPCDCQLTEMEQFLFVSNTHRKDIENTDTL